MESFLNFIIVICLITTFIVLLIGLFHTARSNEENNKINLFMRYRVAIQFVTLTILTVALFLKS